MPDPGTSSEGSSSTTKADSSTSSTSSASSTSAGDTSGSSTGTEPPPDLGPPGPVGCLGKIDFLFVISNSGTMAGHQAQVLTIFPAFLDSLTDEFKDFDAHIMVVETDGGWFMGDCGLCGEGCDPGGVLPACGAELTACDSTMGAGVTFPAGKDSSAQRCPLADGRYITSKDADAKAAFECIAKVGSGGGVDRPAEAMVAALSSPLLGTNGYPPGCNQGFLRDDALLVVTLIADGADGYSPGPVKAWREALMDAKHQDAAAFQVLVITTDIDTVNGLCGPYTPDVNRLRTFVEMTDGLIGSICAEDYGPFFKAAATAIVERCKTYVPQ